MRVVDALRGTVGASCGTQLTDSRPRAWDGQDWYHPPCYTLAWRQDAEAQRLARRCLAIQQ
jgi:hypothetical protein